MTTATANPNYHGQLVANTVDTITLSAAYAQIAVLSDGSARIDYTTDGSNPVVGGTESGRTIYQGVFVDTFAASPTVASVVKLISAGTPSYSIEPVGVGYAPTPSPTPTPTPTSTRSMGDGTPAGWQEWVTKKLAAPSIWAYGPAWTAADLAALAAAWPSTSVLALDNTGASPKTCQVLDVESVDVTSASVAESWIEDRLADVGPYMISRPTLYMNVDGSYYLGKADDVITPLYNAGLYLGEHYDLWLAKTGGAVPSEPYMTAAGPAHASVGSVATQYASYSDTGSEYDLDVVFDASWYPTGA